MRKAIVAAIILGGSEAIAQGTSTFRFEVLEMEVSFDILNRICGQTDSMCACRQRKLAILLAGMQLYELAPEERLACFDRRSIQFMPSD